MDITEVKMPDGYFIHSSLVQRNKKKVYEVAAATALPVKIQGNIINPNGETIPYVGLECYPEANMQFQIAQEKFMEAFMMGGLTYRGREVILM